MAAGLEDARAEAALIAKDAADSAAKLAASIDATLETERQRLRDEWAARETEELRRLHADADAAVKRYDAVTGARLDDLADALLDEAVRPLRGPP